ncbi:MAG: transcription termination factor Rho [Verrucomicrobiales bacterium]|jgi:transcription termination factor Rho
MAKKEKKDPKLKSVTKKVAKKTAAKKKSAAKKTTTKKTVKKTVKVKKKISKKKVTKKKPVAELIDEIPELPFGDGDAGEVIEATTATPKAKKKAKPKKKSDEKKTPKKQSEDRPKRKKKDADPPDGGVADKELDSPDGENQPATETQADKRAAKSDSDSTEEAGGRRRSSRNRSGRKRRERGERGERGDSNPGASAAGGRAASKQESEGRPDTGDEKKAPEPKPKPEPKPEPEPEPIPGPPPPERVDLAEFQQRSVAELYELGSSMNLRVGGISSKHDLIFEILTSWGHRGTKIDAEGILEITTDGFGFLRWPAFNFTPHADDVYISPNLIRDHHLQNGNLVRVVARAPREREKFISVDEVTEVEGIESGKWERPTAFDKLTALSPRERLVLEDPERRSVSPRAVDIIAPLGKGQRGVIVAPPRGGKTILLKEIAGAISRNHPETEVIVLLLDERPEEVTDFEESGVANVYSSTFDEAPERHVQVAELVAARAQRLVEIGKDVVILMDSLTRLARGYNGLTKGKGKTGSGGIDHGALQKARRLFNIARNTEEAGSLTLVATALIDTGARMDDVIFEEFKGSGNMELELDRELLERRIFPAINIQKSGTRKDDLLYHPDEFKRIGMIRRQLAQLPGGEAMEKLIHNIENTRSNAELLLAGLK